jgi:hypothetical protein
MADNTSRPLRNSELGLLNSVESLCDEAHVYAEVERGLDGFAQGRGRNLEGLYTPESMPILWENTAVLGSRVTNPYAWRP